jgi:excinuclease ABC subunit C
MLKVKTQGVPKDPGVYWYLSGKKVIYVGKAKNLKNRLNNYRQIGRLDEKTMLMLQAATSFKYKELESEVEAIITEARLIKLYQPRYNIILKDDKSPIYLAITKEDYPRLLTARKQDIQNWEIPISHYYGPFTSARTLRRILERLRHIFPYCTATPAQKKQKRACFYYHLDLCPGACVGAITPEAYKKNIRQITWFFLNKKKRLLSSLKREMVTLSKAQNYQGAQIVKDQLMALTYFWQAQFMPLELPRLGEDQTNVELQNMFKLPISRIETYDISNLSGTNPTGAMVVATDGRIDKSQYRLFNIRSLNTPNDPQMMAEMIARRVRHSDWGRPDLIVVDGSTTQIKAILKILPVQIPVVGLAKNPDRLVFYDPETKTKTVRPLTPTSSAARLLIQLRDEAHRFGRKQHLRLRERSLLL